MRAVRLAYLQGPAPCIGFEDTRHAYGQIGAEEGFVLALPAGIAHEHELDGLIPQRLVPEGGVVTVLHGHGSSIEGDRHGAPVATLGRHRLRGGQAAAAFAGPALLPRATRRRGRPECGIQPQSADDVHLRRPLLQRGACRVGAVADEVETAVRCPLRHLGDHLLLQLQSGGPWLLRVGGIGRATTGADRRARGGVPVPAPLGAHIEADQDGQGEALRAPHRQRDPEREHHPEMAKAEEGFARCGAQGIVVHGAQRDTLAVLARQGIVAEQKERLVGGDPAQRQREEDTPHRVEAPLGPGEEAMEHRDMARSHRPGGEHDRGDGTASQAMHPAGDQHGEVGGAGGMEAGGEGTEQGEKAVR